MLDDGGQRDGVDPRCATAPDMHRRHGQDPTLPAMNSLSQPLHVADLHVADGVIRSVYFPTTCWHTMSDNSRQRDHMGWTLGVRTASAMHRQEPAGNELSLYTLQTCVIISVFPYNLVAHDVGRRRAARCTVCGRRRPCTVKNLPAMNSAFADLCNRQCISLQLAGMHTMLDDGGQRDGMDARCADGVGQNHPHGQA